jgi:hypothetical protein
MSSFSGPAVGFTVLRKFELLIVSEAVDRTLDDAIGPNRPLVHKNYGIVLKR